MPGRGSRLQVEKNRVLLVEGVEDQRFLSALLRLGRDVQIVPTGGKDRLRVVLDLVVGQARKLDGLLALGVVRDADDSADRAFASVADALRSRSLRPPDRHGEYSEGSGPAVGVFIAPDGMSPGSMETLLVRSVEDEAEARCTEEYLDCVTAAREAPWNAAKRDKAFAYSYLAVSLDPEERHSVGAAQGIWKRESPAFADLIQFVKHLSEVGG